MSKAPTIPRKSIPKAELSDWYEIGWYFVGLDQRNYSQVVIEWPHAKPPVAPYKVAAIPATVEGMVA